MPVSLRYAARSDVGLGAKSRNEDSAYAGPERGAALPESGAFLLVQADGAGAEEDGAAMADLMRALPMTAPVDWMAVSSYGSGTKSSGVVRILKDLDTDVTDRIRVATETLYQGLIDAEAAAFIGAGEC